jgi:hypothetical protein
MSGKQLRGGSIEIHHETKRAQVVDELKALVTDLRSLKRNNVDTATALDVHPSIVSKLLSKEFEDPRMGNLRLRALLELIPRLIDEARDELFGRCTVRPNVVILDRCATRPVPDELIIAALEQNLRTILTGSHAERCPLPARAHGVLAQLGAPEFGCYMAQVEAETGEQRFRILRHEVAHLEARRGDRPVKKLKAAY